MKIMTFCFVVFILSLLAGCSGYSHLSTEQQKEVKNAVDTLQKHTVALETGSESANDLLQAQTDVKLAIERAKLPEGQLKTDINATLDVFKDAEDVLGGMRRTITRRGIETDDDLELVKKLEKKYPSSFTKKDPDLADAFASLQLEARKAYDKVAGETN